MQVERGIQYFPIALFASVMGVSGLAMSLRLFENYHGFSQWSSNIVMVIATIMLLINVVILLYRLIAFREGVRQDFNHPVKMNFFAAMSISFLLLGALYIEVHSSVSLILWLIGTILQFIFTLLILTKLMWVQEFKFAQFNPAWFIPIVGNIVVPLAGVEHASPMVNWMFFGIGVVFSIIYFTLFMNRIFFHPTLPPPLMPTLFILLAPPGIGAVSYINMTGNVDYFVYIMYGFAFYLGLLLIYQIRRFVTIPFFVSWWAFLFPSAAVTNATFLVYEHTGEGFLLLVFYIQIVGLILLTIYLFAKTIGLMIQGKLCVKEG